MISFEFDNLTEAEVKQLTVTLSPYFLKEEQKALLSMVNRSLDFVEDRVGALPASLVSMGNVTTGADNILYTTSPGVFSNTYLSPLMRSVLAQTTQFDIRNAIGASPVLANTDSLAEGAANLYYTDVRVDALAATREWIQNPTTTTGDLIYRDSGGNTTRLPIGLTGDVLSVVGGIPTWQSAMGGGVVDGDKGDVVVTGGGLSWNLDSGVVTNTKLATTPTLTLKGNNTGSAASPADLTVAQVKTMLAYTAGDVGADASGAAATAQAFAVQRANHTGSQTASTISDFSTAVAATAAVAANTAKVTNATHSGDAAGATTLTLATVNSNVGAFGSATQIPTFTVNAKGLTTAAANVAISIPASQVSDFSEAVDDRVATLAVAGTNMTITYNDVANTLTFDAAGGGAGTNLSYTAATRVIASDTGTDATLPLVSTGDAGLAPASGGGTTNFLRADGTWAAPSGGGGSFSNTVVSLAPSANQQDWTITGKTSYTTVLASPTDNSWIGGIAGGSSGDVLYIQNASASGLIWLVNEDASSTAANRMTLSRQGTFLLPNETVTLVYNATSSRWVEVAASLDLMVVDDRCQLTLPLTAATVQNMGVGGTAITATASTVGPTATPTNDFAESPRTQVTNSTAAGSSSVRAGLALFMRGATAGRQGIFHNSRVQFSALGATGGVCVGMTSSIAAITTQPSATPNCILLGADGGQTTLRVIVRDGAAGTPIDLGANFPVPSGTAAYEVAFLCMPNAANVRYMVRRLDSDFRAQGTVTANLPANTLALGHRINTMVGATATASTALFTRMRTRSVS